jgi:GTPase SAR1 family protein
LTTLEELRLDNNRLLGLPESIGGLTNLRRLWLFNNQLRELPETIGELAALEDLWLDGNLLTELPGAIGRLKRLTQLRICQNQLRSLPNELGGLVALRELSLVENELTSLPNTIGDLQALRELVLDANELARLPETLGNLTHLMLLTADDNQLTSLPLQLGPLLAGGVLRTLSAERNPLRDPLSQLLRDGLEPLRDYLMGRQASQGVREVKVLLVGEPTMGKSSVLAALGDQPFQLDREATHGIAVEELEVAGPGEPALVLRFWDFGGQRTYAITHQSLYSEGALYLLVWNTRAEEGVSNLVAWLRRIRARVGSNAQVILVGTHGSGRRSTPQSERLRRGFPGMIRDECVVDNRTGEGIAELRTRLAVHAAAMEHTGTILPESWTQIRDAVRRRSEDTSHLTLRDFRAVCGQHGVHEPETQLSLAGLMHELGDVIYHPGQDDPGDILVLDPEWLANAVAAVLADGPTREAAGVLDHSRLREIWRSTPGGPEYSIDQYSDLLRLMEGLDASWRLEGGQRSLIAELVPRGRPRLPWLDSDPVPDGVRQLRAFCRLRDQGLGAVDVNPALGLIAALTVRLHQHSTGAHWQTGVFLRHANPAFLSEALVELRPLDGGVVEAEDRHTQVLIEVRAPDPGFFFDVLLESVGHLTRQRWPGLTPEYLVPCPGRRSDGTACSHSFPLMELRHRRGQSKAVAECMTCQSEHDIGLLLTGFGSPGVVAADPVRHLEGMEARILDAVHRVELQVRQGHDDLVSATRLIWQTLVAVNQFVRDVPRLCTISRRRAEGVGETLQFFREYYELWLWCEHAGEYHPVLRVPFDRPQHWVRRIAPYARLMFGVVRSFLPWMGQLGESILSSEELVDVREHLTAIESFDEDVLQVIDHEIGGGGSGEMERLPDADGAYSPASALVAFRALLLELRPTRVFDGLEPMVASSGEVVWVCQEHRRHYRSFR